ncbi:MAG TPA: chemotaxis protein CheW [Gemmatimonadales bacterium]
MPTADIPQGVDGLVVRVAGIRRYITVTSVVEVLREVSIIRVPGAVPAVLGMVNHRGRVLTVADARRALDLAGDQTTGREIVVVDWQARRFGVAVDAVVELVAGARTGLAEIELDRIAAAVFG